MNYSRYDVKLDMLAGYGSEQGLVVPLLDHMPSADKSEGIQRLVSYIAAMLRPTFTPHTYESSLVTK